MARTIGIVHRVKQTAEGAARPTMVAILSGKSKIRKYDLEAEQDELDFVLAHCPVAWRAVEKDEDLSEFQAWQIKRDGKKVPKKVPKQWDGIKAGDTVVMALGGSGDRLAFSICRKLKQLGGKVMRITPAELSERRQNGKKDCDHELLVQLFQSEPMLFQEMSDRDLDLIKLREAYFARTEAMKARMGCAQRLRQRFIGQVFLSEEGGYPEGAIEDQYDAMEANDMVLKSLVFEERRREAELKKAVEILPVWQQLFEPIEGVGPLIAARLIVAIGDIRRFSSKPRLKKYCGAHVMDDGRFPRRRNGETAGWKPEARQALYLLGDQFNRRPDSVWGLKLREYKVKFRTKHPEVEVGENGKKKYTPAHIHKMATWRTITKFVEWLHREWWKVEKAMKVEAEKAA